MMRSANPSLTPEQCKLILINTSYEMNYRGHQVMHVADAGAALKAVQQRKK